MLLHASIILIFGGFETVLFRNFKAYKFSVICLPFSSSMSSYILIHSRLFKMQFKSVILAAAAASYANAQTASCDDYVPSDWVTYTKKLSTLTLTVTSYQGTDSLTGEAYSTASIPITENGEFFTKVIVERNSAYWATHVCGDSASTSAAASSTTAATSTSAEASTTTEATSTSAAASSTAETSTSAEASSTEAASSTAAASTTEETSSTAAASTTEAASSTEAASTSATVSTYEGGAAALGVSVGALAIGALLL